MKIPLVSMFMTSSVREGIGGIALPSVIDRDSVQRSDFSPEFKKSLLESDVFFQFGVRIDDPFLFKIQRAVSNWDKNGEENKSYCSYVQKNWAKKNSGNSEDIFTAWKAFLREDFNPVFLGKQDDPISSDPLTSHGFMKKTIDFIIARKDAEKNFFPVLGTYLSSFTVRSLHKMFLYPFECIPMETLLFEAKSAPNLGFDWRDILLHEGTLINYTAKYAGQVYPQNPDPKTVKYGDSLAVFGKNISLFSAFQNLHITERRDSVPLGYKVSLLEKKGLAVFPGYSIPYSFYDVEYDKSGTKYRQMWSTYPEWYCRFPVNLYDLRIRNWWAEKMAEEIEQRSFLIHNLSRGKLLLNFVFFDNVTPRSGLLSNNEGWANKMDCACSCACDSLQSCKDCPSHPSEVFGSSSLVKQHIRFQLPSGIYSDFFRLLRQKLNDRSKDKPHLHLSSIRFVPNIPGHILENLKENKGIIDRCDGICVETMFGGSVAPHWMASNPEQIATMRSMYEEFLMKGKWIFFFINECRGTGEVAYEQRRNLAGMLSSLALLLGNSSDVLIFNNPKGFPPYSPGPSSVRQSYLLPATPGSFVLHNAIGLKEKFWLEWEKKLGNPIDTVQYAKKRHNLFILSGLDVSDTLAIRNFQNGKIVFSFLQHFCWLLYFGCGNSWPPSLTWVVERQRGKLNPYIPFADPPDSAVWEKLLRDSSVGHLLPDIEQKSHFQSLLSGRSPSLPPFPPYRVLFY